MNHSRLMQLICVCAIVYIMSYFNRVTPTILSADLLGDFQITSRQLGLFSSATLLAYGLFQLPSGMVTDLFGGKRVLFGLCMLAGFGTLLFAFSHSLETAFCARFLTGVGAAVTVPIVAVLAQWCPPRLFVRTTSFIFGMAGLGGLLAAPPLHFLNALFGWRDTMSGFGVFNILLGLLVLASIPGMGARKENVMSCRNLFFAMLRVFRSRIFWTLGIWYMMVCGASYCMSTLWWGPYLMQGLGMDRLQAANVVSGISIGIMAAFFILGAVAGTIFKKLKRVLIGCTLIACVSLCILVCWHGALPLAVVTLLAAAFTGCTSAVGPITYSFFKNSFPVVMAGTAVGVVNMTFPIWSSLLQYIFGWIIDAMPLILPSENPFEIALAFIFFNCLLSLIFLLLYSPADRHLQ